MQKHAFKAWQQAFAEWHLRRTDETAEAEKIARDYLLLVVSQKSVTYPGCQWG